MQKLVQYFSRGRVPGFTALPNGLQVGSSGIKSLEHVLSSNLMKSRHKKWRLFPETRWKCLGIRCLSVGWGEKMSTLEGADEDSSAGQWVVVERAKQSRSTFLLCFFLCRCFCNLLPRNGTSEAKVGDFVVFTWEGHFWKLPQKILENTQLCHLNLSFTLDSYQLDLCQVTP